MARLSFDCVRRSFNVVESSKNEVGAIFLNEMFYLETLIAQIGLKINLNMAFKDHLQGWRNW